MKLDLSDVTICAVDSANVALTVRALRLSMARCKFADAILFTHATVDGAAFRIEKIPKVRSTVEYSYFCYKQLPTFINTPFVLMVQWDGYVVEPSAWSSAFREYDYIGARWPFVTDGMSVGNGGFSLRSRKFLRAVMKPRFTLDARLNSDWLICRSYRPELEKDHGIRFAPENVADLFSHEKVVPTAPTFGFHSLENMWRHVDDTEMFDVIRLLNAHACSTETYSRLMMAYFDLGKFELMSALCSKMRRRISRSKILQSIRESAGDQARATECIRMCERLSPSRRLGFVRRFFGKVASLFEKSRVG
ncbi:MAG: hypothetical protein QOH39_1007 [Verrucomicrobiota bacterium]|jgi:hypothetical protein